MKTLSNAIRRVGRRRPGARARRGDRAPRAQGGADHHPQRLVRPDARALSRVQRRVRKVLEEQDRPDRDRPGVARRLGQPGPRGHRRARSRRRHAGARLRRRRHRQRRPDRQGLAEAAAEQQHAVHVDDRVPRAEGKPQEHQGLGRPRQAGHPGHHAESRRRPAARSGTTWPRGSTRGRCRAAATRPPAPS